MSAHAPLHCIVPDPDRYADENRRHEHKSAELMRAAALGFLRKAEVAVGSLVIGLELDGFGEVSNSAVPVAIGLLHDTAAEVFLLLRDSVTPFCCRVRCVGLAGGFFAFPLAGATVPLVARSRRTGV
jgi:hypothetical protein